MAEEAEREEGQLTAGVCRSLVDFSNASISLGLPVGSDAYVQVVKTAEEPHNIALRRIYIHDGVEKIFVYCKTTDAVTWENGSILSITKRSDIIDTCPMKNILACRIAVNVIQKECEFLQDIETLQAITQDNGGHRCWKCGNWNLEKERRVFGKSCAGEKEFQGCEKYTFKHAVAFYYCAKCKHNMCSHCLGKYGYKNVTAQRKRKLDHTESMMTTLWEEKEDTGDITIKCSDGEVKCHRMILLLQPSFFKTAVALPMREANEGMINFTEIADKKLILLVLEWIYFGALTAQDVDLLKLFKLAAYCQLPKLVDHIATRLGAIVSTENVKDILKTLNDHKSMLEVKTLRERLTTRISADKDLLSAAIFP